MFSVRNCELHLKASSLRQLDFQRCTRSTELVLLVIKVDYSLKTLAFRSKLVAFDSIR